MNGTIESATWTTDTFGPASSRALSLDGVDDYVAIDSDLAPLLPQSFTWSAWVKTTTLVGRHVIDMDEEIIMAPAFSMAVIDNTLNVNAEAWHAGITTVNDNAWHHLAFTLDHATGIGMLYVDGVHEQPGVDFTTAHRVTAAETFFFGVNMSTEEGGLIDYFPGAIDDVRMYNRALTVGEIASLATGVCA
jgi:hypothetical protein